MYQMLVSYTVCCRPEVSVCAVPELPARSMAIEARHGLNESGRSTQGMLCVNTACTIILLMIPKLLAANLEEADPTVYEILQRVHFPLDHDLFHGKIQMKAIDA